MISGLQHYIKANLACNPFSKLSSEALGASVRDLHIWSQEDYTLADLVTKSLREEMPSAILLTAPFGYGKTERLLLLKQIASEAGYVAVYMKADSQEAWRNLLKLKSALSGALQRRILVRVMMFKETSFTAENLLASIKALATKLSPCLIEIDEIEKPIMHVKEEASAFLYSLHELLENCKITLLLAGAPGTDEHIRTLSPQFYAKISHIVRLRPLAFREALEFVSKRMTAYRIKPAGEPLFPFTSEALRIAYKESEGNPRYLLRILHKLLTLYICDDSQAVIDASYVMSKLGFEKNMTYGSPYEEYFRKLEEKFGSGVFTYIQASRALDLLPNEAYELLEEMTSLGIVEKVGLKFRLKLRSS